MRLEQFISKTSYRRNGEEVAPTISLNRNNCRLYFNRATVDILGISAGDSLAFYQDTDRPLNWYFTKVRKGFANAEVLWTAKNCRRVPDINSGPLSKAIMDSANAGQSCCLVLRPITIDGRGYWQIVTDK